MIKQVIPLGTWSGNKTRDQVTDDDLCRLTSDEIIHSILEVKEFPQFAKTCPKECRDGEKKVYRIVEVCGYSGPTDGKDRLACPIDNDDANAEVVILDDSGNGFRDDMKSWPQALTNGTTLPKLVIHKVSRPLPGNARVPRGLSALWKTVKTKHHDRAVVVIDANDLRREEVMISRRLSWERTAREFVWQMAGNGILEELRECRHLIVRFGLDGAVHYQFKGFDQPPQATLYYDSQRSEDDFADQCPGVMVGSYSAFIAAFAARLIADVSNWAKLLPDGIRAGLQASRRVLLDGLIVAPPPMFGPVPSAVEKLRTLNHHRLKLDHDSRFESIAIPQPVSLEHPDPERWNILTSGPRRGNFLEDIAYEAVRESKVTWLREVPEGKFGELRTLDRAEIESYRAIRNLIREYLNQPTPKHPLCIAVFGPPGSGKSFGVEQVAKSVAQGSASVEKIEFNVSQFSAPEELAVALNAARDRTIGGVIPLVFFDEFDADYGGPYGWLKYFLAPMHDGTFFDRGAMHPIGKAIFVFAGGTRRTFEEFYPANPDETPAPSSSEETTESEKDREKRMEDTRTAWRKFRDAKGPDFVSRLRGYINILGPNPVDPHDNACVIRRAILLRSLLERKVPHLLDANKRISIDDRVLRALLKVSSYLHSSRSMEAIIEMSMLANRYVFEPAALPSPEQLELHVPTDEFYHLIQRDRPFGQARDRIARAIHERYRRQQASSKRSNHPSMQPWDQLRRDLQDSNYAQADDIPNKLRAVQLGYEYVGDSADDLESENKKVFDEKVPHAPNPQLELLAEMEHERWMTEKLCAGWVFGETRNDPSKVHDCLIPWSTPIHIPGRNTPFVLSDKVKQYDRDAIQGIPLILAEAGYRLFPLPQH
ncbi:MAG: RyR domain-containing protein [Planctomycetota bacterium]